MEFHSGRLQNATKKKGINMFNQLARPITFSVVIPVYNAKKFLSKCLEHLVHQTYPYIEIVVVDDGSTDGVADIYNTYAAQDERIIIIHQQNAGPSVASNTGLDAASGEYVHFHDHDDWVNLDYFEQMAKAAEQTEADILCGEVNQPEYNFPRFASVEILTNMRDKILKTRANKLNPAWRYVYRKDFLIKNNLRFNPKIFGAQDLFFSRPAIVLAQTVVTVPNAVYNVVDTDTALGKSRAKIRSRNADADLEAARYELDELLQRHGAVDYMNMEFVPTKTHTLKVFNMNIFRTCIFENKIRYYLFGLNIGTKRLY